MSLLVNENRKRMTVKYIDLSHTIADGTITYKGLPAPIICDYLSREESKEHYAEGTEFQIGKIEMVSNTGTYLDCPFHRYHDGKDLSEIALEKLVEIPGTLVNIPYTQKLEITVADLQGVAVKDRAILINTGWSTHWGTDQYFENHPFLTEDAAIWLRDHGAKIVGIDSHNIDNTSHNTRPVHTTLLGAEILIVEHLCNLKAIPDKEFTFSAIPPKFKGVGTFPVRALVTIKG